MHICAVDVGVCVCVRERERERAILGEGNTQGNIRPYFQRNFSAKGI